MKLDWDRINDQDFEELCYSILRNEGFLNIRWIGRSGGDRGRDITCIKNETPFPGMQRTITYIAQCKKWQSRAPAPSDLSSTIAWAEAHRPNVLMLMVSNILTSDTNDWIDIIKTDKSYDILVYDLKLFEEFLERNNDIYVQFFETPKGYYYNKIKDLKTEILNKLTNKASISSEPFSKELGISIDYFNTALSELEQEGILKSEKDRHEYYLVKSIEAFTKICDYVLSSNYRYLFLHSAYSTEMINTDLVRYVANRYFVELSEEEMKGILVMFSISPSCLFEALFSNVEKFKNQRDHIKQLGITGEQAVRFNSMAVNDIVENYLELLLLDLKNPQSNNIVKEKGIRGISIKIHIRMANENARVLDADSDTVITINRASGPIKAGQLLSASSPDYYINSSLVLSKLGIPEKAIEDIDMALSQLTDPDKLKNAWNNKGVFLMDMGKFEDATICFDKAISIDPNFDIAIQNRDKCKKLVATAQN